MSSRLSKIRSVHTYVMLRTVYFGWICIFKIACCQGTSYVKDVARKSSYLKVLQYGVFRINGFIRDIFHLDAWAVKRISVCVAFLSWLSMCSYKMIFWMYSSTETVFDHHSPWMQLEEVWSKISSNWSVNEICDQLFLLLENILQIVQNVSKTFCFFHFWHESTKNNEENNTSSDLLSSRVSITLSTQ